MTVLFWWSRWFCFRLTSNRLFILSFGVSILSKPLRSNNLLKCLKAWGVMTSLFSRHSGNRVLSVDNGLCNSLTQTNQLNRYEKGRDFYVTWLTTYSGLYKTSVSLHYCLRWSFWRNQNIIMENKLKGKNLCFLQRKIIATFALRAMETIIHCGI